jgi:hypothetical protein
MADIQLDNSPKSFIPGSILSGMVEIEATEPEPASKIEIVFEGQEIASIFDESAAPDADPVEESIPLWQEARVLWTPVVSDTFGPAKLPVSFNFPIPEHLSPSLDVPPQLDLASGTFGRIEYRLVIRVQVEDLRTVIGQIPIKIDPFPLPSMASLPMPFITQSQGVGVNGMIEGSIFAPGNTISGNVMVEVPKAKTKGMEVALQFRYSFTAKGQYRDFTHVVSKDQELLAEVSGAPWQFELLVPNEAQWPVQGHLVRLWYEIDFKVFLPKKQESHVSFPILLSPLSESFDF